MSTSTSDDPKPPEGPPVEGESQADRGISDFVRRAVSAGLDAASRGKDEVTRVATTEIRNWLDRMDLDSEIVKALSRMVVDVKAEIRFRERPDGTIAPEVVQETKIRPDPKE